MNTDNVKSQMRKGILEYCTLLILQKRRAYVSDIIQSLKEAKLIVVEGTLYPLLSRLKNSGLLTYVWEESTQGPPRKYYELTPEGTVFLSLTDYPFFHNGSNHAYPSLMIFPSSMTITRSAVFAISRLCVIMMMVCLYS